jgi:hypothetical protein
MDGVSRDELERLLAAGRLPVLGRLVRDGRLEVGGWQPLLPPCTPASQAGILHGRNDGIPGFRWFEKDARRLMVANHPPDAAEIERRLSDGRGLLAEAGVSIGNLLRATRRQPSTMATIGSRDGGCVTATTANGSSSPETGARFTIDPRTWGAILVDTIRSWSPRSRVPSAPRRRRPRMRRGWRYALERLTNVRCGSCRPSSSRESERMPVIYRLHWIRRDRPSLGRPARAPGGPADRRQPRADRRGRRPSSTPMGSSSSRTTASRSGRSFSSSGGRSRSTSPC